MVPSAPRYHPRIVAAVRLLDDEELPMAEICRRVGEDAWAEGLPRPSYVHLRRLIKEDRERRADERARREEIREIVGDTIERLMVGRLVDAYVVADRIHHAGGER